MVERRLIIANERIESAAADCKRKTRLLKNCKRNNCERSYILLKKINPSKSQFVDSKYDLKFEFELDKLHSLIDSEP